MADISTTQTFLDGDQVTAAKMNNIVGNSSLLPTSISGKSAKTVADGTNDYVLMYDSTTSTLVKANPNAIRNATGAVYLPSTLQVANSASIGSDLNVEGNLYSNGMLVVDDILVANSGVYGGLLGDTSGAHNGPVGNTNPSTGKFTTINASGASTLTGVVSAPAGVNGNLTGNTSGSHNGAVGDVTPSTGRFTTINASGTITGNLSGSSTSCTGNSATASACTGNSATATTATTASACSGNSATATNLSTNRTNWDTNGTLSAVVGQLGWKKYGNNHTIFDASSGLSPQGTAVDNANARYPWTSNQPVLMGWNGGDTWGVRVDSARAADSAVNITAHSINQSLATTSQPTFDTVYTGNWFRSNGATGWYSQTYNGGIHMNEATYVRTYGSKSFYCDQNILAGLNVTAYSDERLKKDWSTFGSDILEKLSEVKSGTYTRIDGGLRQVGVSAQSLQKVMPDAVSEGENGHLTVAYGNAALASCVELAKEVVALRQEIALLKSKIG
jgi:Chaperone of endosialidase